MKAGKSGFQSDMVVFAIAPGETAELNVTLKSSSNPIRSAVEEVGASWIRISACHATNPKGRVILTRN